MEEIWIDIYPELKLSQYQVSSFGRIKNKKSNYIFNPKPRKDGYLCGRFLVDNEKNKLLRSFYYHRIIGYSFLKNPKNLLTIDHINKKRNDNRIENLRWSTYTDQNKNRNIKTTIAGTNIYQCDLNGNIIKKWKSITDAHKNLNIKVQNICRVLKKTRPTAGGFKWIYANENLHNEIWKKVPLGNDYINTFASNLGRIKTSNILLGCIKQSGYVEVAIKNIKENKHKTFKVHILICKAFKGDVKNKYVNHIDENRSNNKIENLEWTTHKENLNHSLKLHNYERPNSLSKSILQISSNSVKEFSSIHYASKQTGISIYSIKKSCLNNIKTTDGIIWRYKV